jgi:hypothetical protein
VNDCESVLGHALLMLAVGGLGLVLCWVSLASGLAGHGQNVCTLFDSSSIQSYFSNSNRINSLGLGSF